ncbi:MAG: hypothetical protein V1725_03775 [archaeon]
MKKGVRKRSPVGRIKKTPKTKRSSSSKKLEQYVLLSANAGGADEHPQGKERKLVRIVPAARAKFEHEKLLMEAFHERYKEYREKKLKKVQNLQTLKFVLVILFVIYLAVFILMLVK